MSDQMLNRVVNQAVNEHSRAEYVKTLHASFEKSDLGQVLAFYGLHRRAKKGLDSIPEQLRAMATERAKQRGSQSEDLRGTPNFVSHFKNQRTAQGDVKPEPVAFFWAFGKKSSRPLTEPRQKAQPETSRPNKPADAAASNDLQDMDLTIALNAYYGAQAYDAYYMAFCGILIRSPQLNEHLSLSGNCKAIRKVLPMVGKRDNGHELGNALVEKAKAKNMTAEKFSKLTQRQIELFEGSWQRARTWYDDHQPRRQR